mmetsp:Transcript_26369/g.39184  ORF Transcript_26369/g.39184 Transcript_26369/m.39184 type:complete len:108 (-) Transcript_26369:222-545(-)
MGHFKLNQWSWIDYLIAMPSIQACFVADFILSCWVTKYMQAEVEGDLTRFWKLSSSFIILAYGLRGERLCTFVNKNVDSRYQKKIESNHTNMLFHHTLMTMHLREVN